MGIPDITTGGESQEQAAGVVKIFPLIKMPLVCLLQEVFHLFTLIPLKHKHILLMHYRVVRQEGYCRFCRLDYGIVCGTVTPERRRKRDIPSDRDITTLRQDDTVTYAYMRIGFIYFNLLFQGFSFTVIYSGNDNEFISLVRMTGLKRPCTRLTPRKEANIPIRKNVIAVTPDHILPIINASRITMPVQTRNTPMNIPLIPNTVRGISRFL